MRRFLRIVPALALAAATLAACGSSSNSASSTGSSGSKASSGSGSTGTTGSSGSTSSTTAAAAAGGGSAASGAKQPHIVIGSANFAENVILADIYADALRAKGVSVTTHLNLGSREIYFRELKSGALNLFPEYNGALLDYLDPSATASSTSAVDTALAKQLPSTLKALSPAAAQDKDSVTVTQAFAKKYHLTSIPQLKAIESKIVFGGPPEFATREEGLIGLKKLYGITFKSFRPLDEAGPISIAALKDGTVQAADIFTTDPSITKDHFVALADPKSLFAAQNIVPIIAKKDATTLIVATLDKISADLTTKDLEQLVAGVELDHADPGTVAKAFVSQAGLS